MTAVRVAARESEWQSTVIACAHLYGWKTMHVRRSIGGKRGGWVTPTSVVGWPDLTLWHEARQRLVFVELKTDTGRITAGQRVVLASLKAAGCEVDVWRPRDFDRVRDFLAATPTLNKEMI